MTIDPAVAAGWTGFSTPLEGCESGLYLDVKGLPTTAIGCLVPTLAAMHALPWRLPDGDLADSMEVADEWDRVRALPPGRVARYYASPEGLHLDADGIAAIVGQRLEEAAVELERAFPDFAAWPAPAQAGALSMSWAMGAGFSASWPRWSAAARTQDWKTCAADCEIRWADNMGVRPRDFAQKALFLLAGGTPLADAIATIPAGSSGDAARRALAAFAFCHDPTDTLPTGAPAVGGG